jgi:ATP-dependent RNA helicase RhlE
MVAHQVEVVKCRGFIQCAVCLSAGFLFPQCGNKKLTGFNIKSKFCNLQPLHCGQSFLRCRIFTVFKTKMSSETTEGFSAFGINKQLSDAILELGWTEPSPVQQMTIPLIKSGKDVLGIAQTGTGKSAAFLIPLIAKLHYPQGEYTRALILAPTKELVTQLHLHFESLNRFIGLRGLSLVGGIGIQAQLKALKGGNDLAIATPGRFLELYQSGEWKLKDIKTLVIDEADRMMDMGFMPQIRKILEIIPRKRQNLLFSATFPEKVEVLSREFLEFPEKVEISPSATPAETISQMVYKTPNFQTKLNLLLHLLKERKENEAILVFVKTKKHAGDIGRFLQRKLNDEVAFLHANKGTNTRLAAVEALHEGRTKVLVSTDLASRGLDVASISMVVNFDLPIQYEDYVHRIGRTGRALRKGKAVSFVNAPDELHLQRIEKLIRMSIPVSKVPKNLVVEETPFEEQQEMDRKLDSQRKKADPEFKGAFHEKKNPIAAKGKPKRTASSPGKRKGAAPAGKAPVRKTERRRGK